MPFARYFYIKNKQTKKHVQALASLQLHEESSALICSPVAYPDQVPQGSANYLEGGGEEGTERAEREGGGCLRVDTVTWTGTDKW